MAFASHMIKIRGWLNTEKWTGEKIEKYIDKKITDEIEKLYHADIELLSIKNNVIEVWVFISAFPSEISEEIINKWLKEHINEDGITVKDFEVIEVTSIFNHADKKNSNVFVRLP